MSLKDKIFLSGAKLLGLMAQQQEHHNPVKTITPGMPELLREAAASGAVLLENRILPLAKGTKLSVFGRILIILCMYLGRIGPISLALFFYTDLSGGGNIRFAQGRYYVG